MFRSSVFCFELSGFFSVTLLGAVLTGCGSDAKSDIEQGQQAITTRACATCHGPNLAGDTKPQPNTMAFPANLTPDMATGMGEWSTDQIVTALLTGVDDEGGTLCAPMPKFASSGMSADEAKSIAAYLKSVAPIGNSVPESTCAEKK